MRLTFISGLSKFRYAATGLSHLKITHLYTRDFMSDLESVAKLQEDILKGMEGCGTSLP